MKRAIPLREGGNLRAHLPAVTIRATAVTGNLSGLLCGLAPRIGRRLQEGSPILPYCRHNPPAQGLIPHIERNDTAALYAVPMSMGVSWGYLNSHRRVR